MLYSIEPKGTLPTGPVAVGPVGGTTTGCSLKPSSERLPTKFMEETLRAGFEVSGFEVPPGVVINIRFPGPELEAVRMGN